LEIYPTPACNATRVPLAPADDGAFKLNWYPTIGNMLLPTVMTLFDEPASSVKPVGVEDLGDANTPLGSSKVTLIAHAEAREAATASQGMITVANDNRHLGCFSICADRGFDCPCGGSKEDARRMHTARKSARVQWEWR
jgi:hypothetical protein